MDHRDCFMCVLTLYVTVCMCDWFVVRCTSCSIYTYVVGMHVGSSDMSPVW